MILQKFSRKVFEMSFNFQYALKFIKLLLNVPVIQ